MVQAGVCSMVPVDYNPNVLWIIETRVQTPCKMQSHIGAHAHQHIQFTLVYHSLFFKKKNQKADACEKSNLVPRNPQYIITCSDWIFFFYFLN